MAGKEAVDKNDKYDRQLRLWGDHGQTALESAKVCLVNANATGTEILKNLILPGIGAFTIVDGSQISGEDLGNNFFLDKDSLGKPRAQVATELLLELNEDVNGDFIDESPENLIENNATFFTTFSIVIATDLSESTLMKLSDLLWEHEVPLMVCHSYGMMGYLRLVIKEHTVVELHPDSAHEDLRLDRPFPGLIRYCDSLDMSSMTLKEHSHTAWLVLIYKFLQKWKAEHNGQLPKNYKEKNLFKEYLREGIRKNADGVPEIEENFDEAIRNVNTSLVPTRVSSDVETIFNDECCNNLTQESKPFWILARAMKDFTCNEGQGALPLRGSIPDMTSDSERYIALQNVYRDKAEEDIASVSNNVQILLQSLGRDEPLSKPPPGQSPGSSPGRPQDLITDADIKLFCKNSTFLRVIRCRSLSDELKASSVKSTDIGMHLEVMDDDDVVWYVLLRAAWRFHTEYNRYPGSYITSMEGDIPKLKVCLNRLLQEWGLTQTIKDDLIHEFCRFGGSELHSIAAYMGGAAAQEAIKIITSQFLPINNTFIYNGIKQTSATIEL